MIIERNYPILIGFFLALEITRSILTNNNATAYVFQNKGKSL